MGIVKGRIVLTGGPCGGKTTALTTLDEKLSDRGYKVFIVNESATELINCGVKCFGENAINTMDFQRFILKLQLMKEQLVEDAAALIPGNIPCVIFYDRGLLDNKAYINQELFNQLLEEKNIKELDLMDRYDKVIHLVTAADGASENYTLANNSARSEGISTAIALDNKTLDAWLGHPNLQVVGNHQSFEDKIQEVVNSVNNCLGDPETIKNQRKYIVDLASSKIEFNADNSTLIHIVQSYVKNSSSEVRIRARELAGDTSYFLTKQARNNGISNIKLEKRILKPDYDRILRNNECFTLEKDRLSFAYKKQYFRLDTFSDGLALLEIEPTREDIELPDFLSISNEVTDDQNYSNYSIAKRLSLKK